MKKTVKRTLWIIAILIGIVILFVLGFGYKFYSETKSMTPSETRKINDSVFCIKDKFVNIFVFKTKHAYMISDAGVSEEGMKAGLKTLGIDPAEVKTILLTHTDGDHIGSIGIFDHPKIYMHKDEEQMINGKNSKIPFMHTYWNFGPYTLLKDDQILDVDGLTVRVFHTPGHSPGSCCFLIGKDYLITGDNLAYKNGKFEHFNSFFNMDTEEQEQSVKSLPDLKSIPFILTAHYGIVRN